MALLRSLLQLTNFRSPLLRTVVPCVGLAFGLQAAVALPSVAAQSERFYDLSGSATYLSCAALSLVLPFWRARAAGDVRGLADYLSAASRGGGIWWWRQAALSTAVAIWAVRRTSVFFFLFLMRIMRHVDTSFVVPADACCAAPVGSFLYQRITTAPSHSDSRFDGVRTKPLRFFSFFMVQATWVSVCLMPVLCINSIPRAFFAASASASAAAAAPATSLSVAPYLTDVAGLLLWAASFALEVAADAQKAQWARERDQKRHSDDFCARGLWSRSRHPNYFGEMGLWSGIALTAAGVVARGASVAGALGLPGAWAGAALCAASPAFTVWVLTRVRALSLLRRALLLLLWQTCARAV